MKLQRLFGEIPGVQEGDVFQSYKDMNRVKVHTPTNAGISGSQNEGAESIVISGGYEDDQDFGDEIIYTGSGGQDSSGRQIADQTLTRSNKALAKNEIDSLPVRVIRGAHKGNPFAPITGYRYDGLYIVDSHWLETGKSGFKMYRFRLLKVNDFLPPKAQKKSLTADLEIKYGRENPKRATQTVQRVIRDSKLGRQLKKLYDYKCQVCDLQIETDAGFYAEAAHIKPVGSPHDGPDLIENLLCLCPNHHVMFDKGVFVVNDDLSLEGVEGRLHLHKSHCASTEFFAYHRSFFKRN